MSFLWIAIFIITLITILFFILYPIYNTASINADTSNFKTETKYKTHMEQLSKLYEPMGNGKRPVTELLSTNIMPEAEQCLVNFYALGCRFTGYLGPFESGYFDPEKAVQQAVNAGCRVFVLEIDYLDECKGETISYFPRLVVRDKQGKIVTKFNSDRPICNSPSHSNIRDVCQMISHYAFDTAQNNTDPVILVLYFLRQPPGSYKSKTVLDYYSNVAKALEPLKNRLVQNEVDGGSYYRQKQEGKLLINNITDYNGKVLIFSNANTSGFRDVNTYSASDDLDFLVNLRLGYTQTKLGVTENSSGSNFGILETVEDFLIIPSSRAEDVAENTKLRWTICFSEDPSQQPTKDSYNKITKKYGVHCIPIQIFSKENDYMFTDKTFKKFSFIPKPEELRYIKPPVVIPGEPNPSTDAKHGLLRSPTV